MVRWLKLVVAAGLVFAVGVGCDTSSPTAPEEPPSPLLLTLSASAVAVETLERVTLTIAGSRADASSVAGISVALSTNIGALSAASVMLDAQGMAIATFTAPDSAGTATITATAEQATASVSIEVTDDRGQVAVDPASLDLDYSRSGSRCPEPLRPLVAVSNAGVDAINFRIVGDLPAWLEVNPLTGPVPGAFEALFTCDVVDGDLDLAHEIRVQGTDPTTVADVGEEVLIKVAVRVRD